MLTKGNLSVKTIWGKVVLYLKEHRQVALHVACGDITDVTLAENKLIINVSENMILSLLEESRREIEKAIRWQGLDLQVIINFKNIQLPDGEQDISKLKNIFDNVSVIDNNF